MLYIPLPFFNKNKINPLFIYLYFREKQEFHIKITNNSSNNDQEMNIYSIKNLENNGKKELIFNKKFNIDIKNNYFLCYNYNFSSKKITIKISNKKSIILLFNINNNPLIQIETNFSKTTDYSNLLSTSFYEEFILHKLLNLTPLDNLERYLEIRDRLVYYNLKTTFLKCYNSAYGKNTNYLLQDDDKNKIKNTDLKLPKKFATFIMCIKNRPKRAILSILSALNHSDYFEYIIVEDKSDNLIDFSKINHPNKHKIQYHLLDLKVPWSRSALLNFGIKRAKTLYVLMWDVDFLFPSFFGKELYNLMNQIDSKKYLVQISLFETEFNYKTSQFYKICDPYSSIWIYSREQLEKIYGFNEMFVGHGFEERELQTRLHNMFSINDIKSHQLNEKCYAYHLSHTDGTRFENNKFYKLRNHNFIIMNECKNKKLTQAKHQAHNWGKGVFPKNYYEKIIKPKYLKNN